MRWEWMSLVCRITSFCAVAGVPSSPASGDAPSGDAPSGALPSRPPEPPVPPLGLLSPQDAAPSASPSESNGSRMAKQTEEVRLWTDRGLDMRGLPVFEGGRLELHGRVARA